MPFQRRRFCAVLPALVGGAAVAQNAPPRMTRVSGEPPQVQVGAGTQGGVTTGSSGPKKKGSGEGAAAGTESSSQPGGQGGRQGARP